MSKTASLETRQVNALERIAYLLNRKPESDRTTFLAMLEEQGIADGHNDDFPALYFEVQPIYESDHKVGHEVRVRCEYYAGTRTLTGAPIEVVFLFDEDGRLQTLTIEPGVVAAVLEAKRRDEA